MKNIPLFVVEWLSRWPLHLTFCAMFGVVLVLAPQQAGIIAYKACLIFGAVIGVYWIRRLMFGTVPSAENAAENDVDTWQTTIMCSAAMIAAALAA